VGPAFFIGDDATSIVILSAAKNLSRSLSAPLTDLVFEDA